MIKHVYGVSEQVQHEKAGKMVKGLKFDILKIEGLRYVVIKKALIIHTVTMQLICPFNFTYAKGRFSHDAAHF